MGEYLWHAQFVKGRKWWNVLSVKVKDIHLEAWEQDIHAVTATEQGKLNVAVHSHTEVSEEITHFLRVLFKSCCVEGECQ